jgi:SAM (Sterile alpha motif) domain-containing protein
MAPADTRGAATRMQSATSPIAAAAPRLPAVGCPKRGPARHPCADAFSSDCCSVGVCLKRTCRAGSRPDPACGFSGVGDPSVTSVSRQTIYRVKLPVRRVPKPESEPGAAMQEIAGWLKKLGMSEYAQRFAENRIDFSVLRDLTDQDLKDLGIVLGDRRKMLRAIAEFAGAVPAPPQPAPTEPKS